MTLRRILALLFIAFLCSSASAAAPSRGVQVPGYFRLMVGDFEVTALLDAGATLDSGLLLGDAESIRTSLVRSLNDDPKNVPGSVNGYLVNTGSKLILIDTGAGGHWGGPAFGHLVRNLEASGYRPEQVDIVLVTHLHADHIGGIYDSRGGRVFPNAEIRMAKADSDFWLSTEVAAKAPPDARIFFTIARDAAKPYIAADKWRPFEANEEIVPGVTPRPIRGHTPGHVGYEIRSRGDALLVWGDVVHLAAVQMPHPEVGIVFDIDGPTAIESRAKLFENLAATRMLVGGAHMPFPGVGRLRKDEAGYTWLPVPFQDMAMRR